MLHRLFFISAVFFACFGCTSDSSDKGSLDTPKTDTPFAPIVFIQGRWSGTMQKSVDTCTGLPDSSTYSFVHEISRAADKEIELRIVDGENHLLADRVHFGSATGTSSYAADVRADMGDGCEMQNSFSYENIIGGEARVTRNFSENCKNTLRCRAIFKGTASKE